MNLVWVCGLFYASTRTIQSHAYLFNDVHGLYIVLFSFLMCHKVVPYEYAGVLFALVGIVVIVKDPSASRMDTSGSDEAVQADIVNAISALFGAMYFLMNAKNLNVLPLFSLIFFQYFHLFWMNAVFAKLLASTHHPIQIFSMSIEHGCFGFLNPSIFTLSFIYFGIFGAVLGMAGYIICLVFFSP